MYLLKFFCATILTLVSLVASAQSITQQLTSELNKLYESSDLPGFSVAIVDEGDILYSNTFGFSNKEKQVGFSSSTVHNLGSVSKTVVGLALIKAVQQGHLNMDDPINKHLSFEVKNPYYENEPILIRHLANHTSSILDTKYYRNTYLVQEGYEQEEGVHEGYLEFIRSHEELSMEVFIKEIVTQDGKWYKKKNFLKAKPGTENDYANLNAALAALVIEGASGKSFQDFTSEYIFEPLNMQSTAWKASDLPEVEMATGYFPAGLIVPKYRLITYPDGGLYSNTEDLTKYLVEIIKAYKGDSQFLPKEFAQQLLPGDDNDDNRAFFGMGQESRNIGHQGSDPGTQVDFQFNADSKIGRIILSNVNAEDNEELWSQYVQIHKILAKYETKL